MHPLDTHIIGKYGMYTPVWCGYLYLTHIFAITCKEVAVGCVLACMCKNVGSIWPYGILAM